jgi:hypothetical protein
LTPLPEGFQKLHRLFYGSGTLNRNVSIEEILPLFSEVEKYLATRYSQVFKKATMDTAEIVGFVFREVVKESDSKNHMQACFLAIRKFVSESIEYIKGLSPLIAFSDEARSEFFRVVLGEVEMFLEVFENTLEPDSTDYGFSRRNILYSSEVFYSTFYHIFSYFDQKTFASIATRPISIFLIRQSVELKIKNALGVYLIRDINTYESIGVRSETYMDFIYKKGDLITLPIDKAILRTILKWSNLYIHTGFMPENYKTWFAMKTIEPLFKAVSNDVDGFHRDGAIVINKRYFEEDLESDIKNFIWENLPKNNKLQVAELYLEKIPPEALIK